MANRSQILVDAARRAGELRAMLGREARIARLAAGATLAAVGQAIGRSASWVSRTERGLVQNVSFEELVMLCAAVGLRLWATTYPGDRPIRDVPQLKLLRRFRQRIGEVWEWAFEVPVPLVGDRRAADAVIRNGTAICMVEAFTRLVDAQAQLRAVLLKARDMRIECVIIVVAASEANRKALAAAADSLLTTFPVSTRAALRALRNGESPSGNAIVLL